MKIKEIYNGLLVKGDTTVDKLSIGSEYSLPQADGLSGQVLTTDGAGNITFQNVDLSNLVTYSSILNGTGLNWSSPSPGFLQGNVTLSPFSTSNLAEGTNLYYTGERVDDRVASLIQNSSSVTWTYSDNGSGAGTLTPSVSLTPFSTSNLAEGTNLYYTDERVDDRVSNLLKSGLVGTGPDSITWQYQDGLNILRPVVSLTPFSTSNLAEGTNLYYTGERVDDRVASLIQNSPTITWTYTDNGSGAGTLVANAVSSGAVITVKKDDVVIGSKGTLDFITGTGITNTINLDNINNKITIESDLTGGLAIILNNSDTSIGNLIYYTDSLDAWTAGDTIATIDAAQANVLVTKEWTTSKIPQNLEDLANVQYSSPGPQTDDVLTFNGTSWENAPGPVIILDSGTGSSVRKDNCNSATGNYSTVSGGQCNSATGDFSSIIGGFCNTASGYVSIANGIRNISSCGGSLVNGGFCNTASSYYSTVGGGANNTASDYFSIVVGGRLNTSSNDYSIVGGGKENSSTANGSIVGGGCNNTSSACNSVINGGCLNTIGQYAWHSGISSGCNNTISSQYSIVSGGRLNIVGGEGGYNTIGGGYCNTVQNRCNTIGGGYCNTINNKCNSVIGGGSNNIIIGNCANSSSILGGCSNTICGYYAEGATIGGGCANLIDNSCFSGILGGYNNSISSQYSSIVGGSTNCINSGGCHSTINGGQCNTVSGYSVASTISGGYQNTVSGNYYATVGGGSNNTSSENFSTISGGLGNTSSGYTSIVGGGKINIALGFYSGILGGCNNRANAEYSNIGGGRSNLICEYGRCSSILGGYQNLIDDGSQGAAISGGWNNYISTNSSYSSIGGGIENKICNTHSAIGSGYNNEINEKYSFIGGGYSNTSSGYTSTISGGYNNTVSGDYSGILGGKNNNDGAYSDAFIIGSDITANGSCTTFVNNLNIYNTPTYDSTNVGVLVRDYSTGLVKTRNLGGLFTQTATSSPVTATTAETSIITTGVGTLTVPANAFVVGDSFVARLCGIVSAANGETLTIRVKSGSVVLAQSSAISFSATTTKGWHMDIAFTVRALGAATVAAIATNGMFTHNQNSGNTLEGTDFNTINNTTFDTTVSNTLDITVQWGSTNATNSIYSTVFILSKVF